MRWCKKDGRGECLPVLKTLLEKTQRSRKVQVELMSGLSFIDEVIGLEGPDASAVAIFSDARRIAISDIQLVAEVA